jgi:multidrug efflux pump subunit AcrA (membrane-fusion protein)
LAQQNYDRQAELFQKRVIAQATLDTYTRNLETARQSLTGAKAEEERARLAYSSNIDGVNTTVARLRSELADAQWDLDQTVTRAPAAGFVTQVSLRPGMYVVPAAFRSVMVFVNTDSRDQEFSAAFQQNSLQRVKAGDEAEAAFDAVPGRVFKGKVRYVLDAIAAGQLQPTWGLVDVGTRTAGGRALAVIDITDDMSPYQIPLGAAAGLAASQAERPLQISTTLFGNSSRFNAPGGKCRASSAPHNSTAATKPSPGRPSLIAEIIAAMAFDHASGCTLALIALSATISA